MDPLTTIMAALLAGAAAGLKRTASTAIKDAYAALKQMLANRHKNVDLAGIERDPHQTDARQTLEQQLWNSGAANDSELMSKAQTLLEEVAQKDPAVASVIGVDIEGIKAGRVRIADIVSAGSGVRVKDATAASDFEIAGVRAGQRGEALGKG
jgi:hypothetical protein